jgi:hypothetical protein
VNTTRLRKSLPAATAVAVGLVERHGRVWHLFSDGGLLPFVAGGSPDADEDKDKDADKDKGKTYTQAEVDRLTSREKDQGERVGKAQGMRDALTALGVDPDKVKVEDLASTLKKALDADEATKTEAQREKDAAAAEKLAATREKESAALERHAAAVERALIRAGVGADEDDDDKRDALITRAAKLVEAEQGADAAKIKTAVEDLKKDMPALFTAPSAEETLPHGDSGGASRTAGGGGAGKDAQARGKALAAELGWSKEKASA